MWVWRTLVTAPQICGFRGPLDTFWSPKSLGRQITMDLRNLPIKKFCLDFHIILYIKNDVFLREILKCSGNDKITSGTVLESWDIMFFTKATLVNICWPLLTNSWNENSSKSWFFAKFTYLQSQIYDISSQQVLTKIILMKSMRSQLSKTVPDVILSSSEHFLFFS